MRERTRPSERNFFVRSGVLEGFVSLVAGLGLDAGGLLRDAGIDPAVLDNPETRIPSLAFRRSLLLAATQSGLPHFGLLLAGCQRLSTIGPLGAAVTVARDVAHGIELTNTFLRLHTEGSFARLEVRGKDAIWSLGLLLPDEPGGREAEDHASAFGLSILRRLTRPDWAPTFVVLPREAPPDQAPYRRYFGCEVLFGGEQSQTVFPAEVLELANPAADWHVRAVLDGYLRELAASADGRRGTEVEQVLAQAVLHGNCSLRTVSRTLGMSSRSLQRRLAEGGTSFQGELAAVRSSVASRYLEEGRMPLTALADMLGYSDLASFSRAFKKARGVSPRAWRQGHARRE